MLTLNYRDSRPLYEQIKDGLRKLMVTGALQPDERLPSVRALATQLSINPNTIQKAYAELERQGVIYSLKGRGSFVGSSLNELRSVQQAALLEEVAQLSGALCQLAVEQETVCAVVREAYQTQREAKNHD